MLSITAIDRHVEGLLVARVADLVRMKLTSYRPKERLREVRATD